MDEKQDFRKIIQGKKVPILVLDQKWHRLFAVSGKPEYLQSLEEEVNRLLVQQGKLNQELKDYKKLKNTLMHNIVDNMEGTGENVSALLRKKLDEDKRLIGEINDKMSVDQEEASQLPKLLKEANDSLMVETMAFCYEKLQTNSKEIAEIAEWIKQVRIELKKNIIKKQDMEINSREMYSYMHDIFGARALDVFDLTYDDITLEVNEEL